MSSIATYRNKATNETCQAYVCTPYAPVFGYSSGYVVKYDESGREVHYTNAEFQSSFAYVAHVQTPTPPAIGTETGDGRYVVDMKALVEKVTALETASKNQALVIKQLENKIAKLEASNESAHSKIRNLSTPQTRSAYDPIYSRVEKLENVAVHRDALALFVKRDELNSTVKALQAVFTDKTQRFAEDVNVRLREINQCLAQHKQLIEGGGSGSAVGGRLNALETWRKIQEERYRNVETTLNNLSISLAPRSLVEAKTKAIVEQIAALSSRIDLVVKTTMPVVTPAPKTYTQIIQEENERRARDEYERLRKNNPYTW